MCTYEVTKFKGFIIRLQTNVYVAVGRANVSYNLIALQTYFAEFKMLSPITLPSDVESEVDLLHFTKHNPASPLQCLLESLNNVAVQFAW